MIVESAAGGRSTESPWQVRLRDAGTGAVLGAGMLVGHRQVLTCAHVVAAPRSPVPAPPPEGEVAVDLVGVRDQPSVLARVRPGCWAPPGIDGSADVVLLDLADHPYRAHPAPLHRRPPAYHRSVWVSGFPVEHPYGRSVSAALGGPTGPRREWVQLDPVGSNPAVSRGFSGAAVHDVENGTVIGMVVGRYDDPDDPLSYMIPIESVLRYLPELADRVAGPRAVDPVSRAVEVRPPAAPDTAGLAERLADWLRRPESDRVLTVVVGGPGSGDSSVVRRAVALSDREWPGRDDAAARSPVGTVPPVGSVALDVDVSGLTVEEVTRRVVDRLRVPGQDEVSPRDWIRSSAPPVNVVVQGLDDARDPLALLADLLGPLVDRGGRLLLVLRRPPAGPLSRAVAAIAAPSAGAIAERLALLRARVAELDEAERAEERSRVALRTRIAPVPPAPDAAVALRLDVTRLLSAAAGATGTQRAALLTRLMSLERAVERALLHVDAVRVELDGPGRLAELGRLRRLLEAYAARGARGGIVEDEELAAAYRHAHALLWSRPCDVPAADRAVRSYVGAVHAAVEERRRAHDDRL